MLTALELPTTDELQVLRRGVELAMELKQHLFDTYYHGVALETSDCILITADERYLRAARPNRALLEHGPNGRPRFRHADAVEQFGTREARTDDGDAQIPALLTQSLRQRTDGELCRAIDSSTR